jgi:enoyl-CoA hydratase
VLGPAAVDPGAAPLEVHRSVIAECFSADSVAGILARLDAQSSAFARKTAATIRTKSPTSLVIAFEQMRRGFALSFEDAMKTEFRIVSRICEGHDFYEGVRATIIDKDAAPRWQPATLEGVTPAMVEAHFAPLDSAELEAA